MKPTVKRCECGVLTNPIQMRIVEDAWIKRKENVKDEEYEAFFEYPCPSCKEKNMIVMDWDER